MAAVILVDSDVLICHLRGRAEARDWLISARQSTGVLAVSAVSVAEVTGGMRTSERSSVWRLLDSLRCFDVSLPVARRAGELQRKHRRAHSGTGLGDYLIAATADVNGLNVATLNVKHYPMFAGLAPPFTLG